MALDSGVRRDDERGVYVYYVVHDGAEIPFLERKFGNVDKRIARAAEQAKQSPPPRAPEPAQQPPPPDEPAQQPPPPGEQAQ